MKKKLFSQLILTPPHHDIYEVNKFIMSSGFTARPETIAGFIKSRGYITSSGSALRHAQTVKKQFKELKQARGEHIDIDVFLSIAGTPLICEYSAITDEAEIIKYGSGVDSSFMVNNHHERNHLINLAMKGFGKDYSCFEYFINAVKSGLVKIGVNPESEINGLSLDLIFTKEVMNAIGGIQFYLPHPHFLQRAVENTNIFIDSYSLTQQELSLKYGLSVPLIGRQIKFFKKGLREFRGE